MKNVPRNSYRKIAASAEALGLEPIYEVFDRLGLSKNPPMPGKISSLDISRTLGVARRILDLNLFVHFYISEDIKNTTRNRIMVRIFANTLCTLPREARGSSSMQKLFIFLKI